MRGTLPGFRPEDYDREGRLMVASPAWTTVQADELADLRRWQAEALELLNELAEHFDNEADCEIDHAGYHPNKAMQFQVECEALIANARND